MFRKSEIFNGVDEFTAPKRPKPRFYGTYQYKPEDEFNYTFKKNQIKKINPPMPKMKEIDTSLND